MQATRDIKRRTKLRGLQMGGESFVGRIQNRTYRGNPTKTYKGIRKTNLTSELLGAGSDPL